MTRYDIFLKFLDYIEFNKKCPYCKDYTLISVSYEELLFLCSKCGKFFIFDIEEEQT